MVARHSTPSVLCAAVLLTLIGPPARSQQLQSRPTPIITGVVYDSLVQNAPLAGADVTIDGTELSAVSDARGRFRLEGVPRGRAVVRFYHPLLDSLGFGAPPVVVTVPDSNPVAVRLATPSPMTFRASLCHGAQPQATGVVIGRIRNVDDRVPLANATATASWTEWSIGKRGMTRADRRVSADGDVNGAFALCGVPNDIAVVVRATAAGHVTGLVEVDLAQKMFAVRDFGVSLADSGSSTRELARLDSAVVRGDSVHPTGASVVAGVVRGSKGQLIEQAQVSVYGYPISVRTGSQGAYALAGLPGGTQTMDVRAIGYAPRRLTVDVASAERRTLDVTLDRLTAQELAPVNIVGRGTYADRTGYDDRRKSGLGQFVTEEEIKRRGVFDTQQALWNVLGAHVVWTGEGNVVLFTRQSPFVAAMRQGSGFDAMQARPLCAPTYWIDGSWFGALGLDADRVVRPYQIRGIEVYMNPSLVPPLYRRPDDQCGVVLIWTNPPQPKQLNQPPS